VAIAIPVVCVVLGMQFMPPLIEPYVGPTVRSFVGEDVGADIDELFAENPMFAAYIAVEPEAGARMRQAVMDAYSEGGMTAARETGYQYGYEIGQNAVSIYGPRAPLVDIRNFYLAMRDFGREMQSRPADCYAFFYSGLRSDMAEPEQGSQIVTRGDNTALTASMASLIRNAGPEPFEFDAEAVAAVEADIGQSLLENYDQSDFRFFLGAVPQNDEDRDLACRIMLSMLDEYLAHPDEEAALRGIINASN